MRTRQGETIDWGYGFALPRLSSRPQEGSGEECGRVSDWGFSEKNWLQILKKSFVFDNQLLQYRHRNQ